MRRRHRRRRRERAQLRDVPARLPAAGALHDLHADAAAEPRRELPREPRLLQPRRGRMGRARPGAPGATSSSTPTAASSTRRAWRRSPTTTRVRFVLGRVTDVDAAPGDRVRLEYAAPEGARRRRARVRRQLHRLRPAGADAGAVRRRRCARRSRPRSASRCGGPSAGRRRRSGATWSCAGCGRCCRSRAWRG